MGNAGKGERLNQYGGTQVSDTYLFVCICTLSAPPTRFYRTVDNAYLTANQRLLDLMLKEQGLITYLR